jgi:predicted glutamine amidotransferase
MCILIVKKQGVKFPEYQHIENSWDNNKDGGSMAWAVGGKTYNFKTLNKGEFLAKYKELSTTLDAAKTAMLIHCRIATHGSIRVENTHCWIDKGTGIAFAHNGILSIKHRDDMTDSQTFFEDIFLPIFRTCKDWSACDRAIQAVIGTSKFAFLGVNGVIAAYGNYNNVDGVLFSNTSYIKRSYVGGTYGYSSSWDETDDYKTIYDCVYDAKLRTTVYRRVNESAIEWNKRKAEIENRQFWDYGSREWCIRENETDEEWALLKELGSYRSNKDWYSRR